MASTRKTNQKSKANLSQAIKPKPKEVVALSMSKEDMAKTVEALKDPESVSFTPVDAINNLVKDDVFKLNHNGKTLYEVIGLSEEEANKLMIQVRLTLQGSELRSIRVEKLVNKCLKNKKQLALLLWQLSK